jgi:hypothetical protein
MSTTTQFSIKYIRLDSQVDSKRIEKKEEDEEKKEQES